MSEFAHQVSLFTWSRIPAVQAKYPGIDLLEGSMNGVKLTKAQAGKAKAAGMLRGSHDIKLPVSRGPYIGLSIELKYGKNKPTEEQLWYGQRLTEEGWRVEYAWSWTDARDVIVQYLGQKDLFADTRAVSGSIKEPSVMEGNQIEG